MLSAVVIAIPDLDAVAASGRNVFHVIVGQVLPRSVWLPLAGGIVVAQYFCGLATVTSTSRMAYAFARDGGLPWSHGLRQVSHRFRTPAVAIWIVSLLSVAFVLHTKTYSTIAGACTMFLYISYAIPTLLGLTAYGRRWTRMGPWALGPSMYRFVAVVSVLGCLLLLLIGVQPPNETNLWTVLVALGLTAVVWFGVERHRFRGPPPGVLDHAADCRPWSGERGEVLRRNERCSAPIKLVGVDCGSTTTSVVVASAQLTRGPLGRVEIANLEPTFQSEMIFTPFRGNTIDAEQLASHLDAWLAAARTSPGEIFGGGASVTGLAAERANAAAITQLIEARLGRLGRRHGPRSAPRVVAGVHGQLPRAVESASANADSQHRHRRRHHELGARARRTSPRDRHCVHRRSTFSISSRHLSARRCFFLWDSLAEHLKIDATVGRVLSARTRSSASSSSPSD